MADETPGSLTGAAKPLCALCNSDEHLAPECPTLTAAAPPEVDEDAEGTR